MNKEEQEILNLNDPCQSYWCCYFNQNTANIKAHEEIVFNSKDPEWCYFFARNIENSNKELLFEVVLQSGDLKCIMAFYKLIDFDKTKYETLMLFL
jgi:hypothetical protein